ncbi:MAG: hypothetical protein JWL96_2125 [Sphingomonas bacterium]|nr:hypothetical protein [Sphingomonas bacterium]
MIFDAAGSQDKTFEVMKARRTTMRDNQSFYAT